jgi:hypothetical protein
MVSTKVFIAFVVSHMTHLMSAKPLAVVLMLAVVLW